MVTKLTDLSIRSLPVPETGQKTYWEKGFGLRVSQGGSRTFVAKVDGRLHTIGRFPHISLKDARLASLRLKVQEPPKQRLQSLPAARMAYLEECEAKNRPNTVRSYRLYLSHLDTPKIKDIKRSDIDHTNPHMVTAWKVFMNWCVRSELIDRNPFAFIPATYNSRSRVLSNEELTALWAYDYEPYATYLKLQILTGQRIGQWRQYTIQNDTLTFPASVMKGKVDHTLPLTETVSDLLPVKPFNGWSNAKKRLDKTIPLDPWTIHDLRRTFSTICASLSIPLHVTEQILAHRTGSISGVAATYNRYNYLKEMREALRKYEAHILSIVA